MIGVRKQHKAFGRGTLTFLYPRNRKILAYIRRHEDERILCVANLSREAQAVELDLLGMPRRGADRADRRRRLPAGRRPALHADAAGLRLLLVPARRARPRRRAGTTPAPDPLPEFVTLTAPGGQPRPRARKAASGSSSSAMRCRSSSPASAGSPARAAAVGKVARHARSAPSPGEPNALVDASTVATAEGASSAISCRSRVLWGEENLRFGAPKLSYTLAKVRTGPKLGALIDAAYDERFVTGPDRARCRRRGRRAGSDGSAPLRGHRGVPRRSSCRRSPHRRRRAEQRLVDRRRRGDAEDLPAARAPARSRRSRWRAS